MDLSCLTAVAKLASHCGCWYHHSTDELSSAETANAGGGSDHVGEESRRLRMFEVMTARHCWRPLEDEELTEESEIESARLM